VLPLVPTMAEAGHGDIECDDWLALLVPAGTPKEITTLLYRRVTDILAQPAVQERLAELGFQPVGNSPEEFAAQIRTDILKRAKLIRDAGIRAQ
jgi:tripartite-type tricarboxylate transporter receptor subunit TctC